MATKSENTTPKVAKAPVNLVEQVKTKLTTAALKQKLTGDELAQLEAHITKLKALLA